MKKTTDNAAIMECIDTYNLQSYLDNDLLPISALCSFEKDEHLIRLETPSE